jgi:hypothetical protein
MVARVDGSGVASYERNTWHGVDLDAKCAMIDPIQQIKLSFFGSPSLKVECLGLYPKLHNVDPDMLA